MSSIALGAITSALGIRLEPAPNYRFMVEIQGLFMGEFQEVSGISARRDVVDYKEGGVNDFVHKFSGHMTYGNVTLKRGITYNPALWMWFQTGLYDGQLLRPNMTVIAITADNSILRHWDFISIMPVSYTGPTLNAGDKTGYTVESVEIAHHGLFMAPDIGVPWVF